MASLGAAPIAFVPTAFFWEADYGTATEGIIGYQPGVFVPVVSDYGTNTQAMGQVGYIPGQFVTGTSGFLAWGIGTGQ